MSETLAKIALRIEKLLIMKNDGNFGKGDYHKDVSTHQ